MSEVAVAKKRRQGAATKPRTTPGTKPGGKPATKPGGKPATKPGGKPAARRSAPGLRWSPEMTRTALLLAAALVVVLAVVWVAWDSKTPARNGGGDAIEHVHGLGINPANGELYAAAHNGLFRLDASGKAHRVGSRAQDTMGFTVVGDDHFLASGHPGQGEDGPAALGLIESTDGGATWTTLSLEGQADFHALRYRHDAVYGFNSATRQLLVSKDKKTWDTRSQEPLGDLVVSPSDPDTLVAAGAEGVMLSTDGGRSWQAGDSAVTMLDWPTDDALWAVAADQSVLRSGDGGKTWSESGKVEGQPSAFAAGEDQTLYLATVEGEILRSTDAGKTWKAIYS
ncbi:MAG: F510_1955 family glycosylhydrolase [Micromonosporaceae bacterium]